MIKKTRRESDVGKLNTGTTTRSLGGPILVDIEAIGGITGDEVIKDHILYVARAEVAFNHKGLITAVGIHISRRPSIYDVKQSKKKRAGRGHPRSRCRRPSYRLRCRRIDCTILNRA